MSPENPVSTKDSLPLQDQILALIQENPGISGDDIRKHFWMRKTNTIVSILDRFQRDGLIENRGAGEDQLSQWYPISKEEVFPEFLKFAQVLISELNSTNRTGRDVLLAKRIQEAFEKNKVVHTPEEYYEMDERIIDEATWADIQRVRDETRRNQEIRDEAILLFGYTTVLDWSIDECKIKVAEIYDRWWWRTGHEGSHPMSPK